MEGGRAKGVGASRKNSAENLSRPSQLVFPRKNCDAAKHEHCIKRSTFHSRRRFSTNSNLLSRLEMDLENGNGEALKFAKENSAQSQCWGGWGWILFDLRFGNHDICEALSCVLFMYVRSLV